KAGGGYLPLDPEYPAERLRQLWENAGYGVLLTQERLTGELPAFDGATVCLDGDWPLVGEGSDENLERAGREENLAYVLYTSGSTGEPKGVMVTHRALCNHMLWMRESFALSGADSVLQKTPYSFDASVWEFYAPLLVGARLVMARPGGHRDSVYLM